MIQAALRLLAVLAAALVAVAAGPAAVAQGGDGEAEEVDAEPVLSEKIQILGVEEIGPDEDGAGGEVRLQLALPPSIGELSPVAANFGILEEGRALDNFTVSAVTTAVDVVVALDTSGSMLQGDRIGAAKQAATTFIEQLPESARAGLVSFDDEARVLQKPGADRQAILDDIAALEAKPDGETALWDGLITSAREVVGAELPIVVVLSDGEDTVSAATQDRAGDAFSNTGVTLYAVAIESSSTDLLALEQTAARVDGQFFDTQNVGELDALYSDIAGRLASRYELVYPTTKAYERDVVISVASEGDLAAFATVSVGTGAPAVPELVSDTPQVLNIPEGAVLGTVPAPTPGFLGGAGSIWIGAGLMFAAMAIFGLLVAWPAREIRLDTAAGVDRVTGINSSLTSAADRLVAKRDGDGALDRALDAAGINLRPGEYLVLTVGVVLAVTIVASLLGGAIVAIPLALITALGGFVLLSVRAGRRRARFAEQLVDTLNILGGGLRAGRGLPQALELVAEESSDPTAGQFQRVVFETRVGRDMTASLVNVADRMDSADMKWVARAIDINRELGGDLTETLDNVIETIRDRQRVARQIQALSAEGRASGWVMIALPIAVFFFQLWRTPDSALLLLQEPLGRLMLGIAVLGVVIGHFWIRRLVQLKY